MIELIILLLLYVDYICRRAGEKVRELKIKK